MLGILLFLTTTGAVRALSSTSLLGRRAWLTSVVVVAPTAAFANDVPPRQEDLTKIGLETPKRSEADISFQELQSGVKYQTLKEGTGSEKVSSSSTVFVECVGRMLNLNGYVTFVKD